MTAWTAVDRCPQDLPAVLPVFPLPAALLLPRAELPLNIFEPRYLAMVDAALRGDRLIGMVQPDEAAPPLPQGPALRSVG
jgi:Lon protease-like protein